MATDADSGSQHEAKAAPRQHSQINESPLPINAKDDKENQDPEQTSKPQPASGTKRKAEQLDVSDESEAKPTKEIHRASRHTTNSWPHGPTTRLSA